MVEKNTRNIVVKVTSRFEENHSVVSEGQYFFSYHITITNLTEKRVQLLRRCWFIKDYTAFSKKVEGDGIIGKQPIIEPGESITYTSFCELHSGLGEMQGYYTFISFSDLREFQVEVPLFHLSAPWLLN
jgi:ApaG protein